MTETRAKEGIDTYSSDRRRECYGALPTPCRSTTILLGERLYVNSFVKSMRFLALRRYAMYLFGAGQRNLPAISSVVVCFKVFRTASRTLTMICVLPVRLLLGKRQLSVIAVCDRRMTQTVM